MTEAKRWTEHESFKNKNMDDNLSSMDEEVSSMDEDNFELIKKTTKLYAYKIDKLNEIIKINPVLLMNEKFKNSYIELLYKF